MEPPFAPGRSPKAFHGQEKKIGIWQIQQESRVHFTKCSTRRILRNLGRKKSIEEPCLSLCSHVDNVGSANRSQIRGDVSTSQSSFRFNNDEVSQDQSKTISEPDKGLRETHFPCIHQNKRGIFRQGTSATMHKFLRICSPIATVVLSAYRLYST